MAIIIYCVSESVFVYSIFSINVRLYKRLQVINPAEVIRIKQAVSDFHVHLSI